MLKILARVPLKNVLTILGLNWNSWQAIEFQKIFYISNEIPVILQSSMKNSLYWETFVFSAILFCSSKNILWNQWNSELTSNYFQACWITYMAKFQVNWLTKKPMTKRTNLPMRPKVTQEYIWKFLVKMNNNISAIFFRTELNFFQNFNSLWMRVFSTCYAI